jgi:hypothetical protein
VIRGLTPAVNTAVGTVAGFVRDGVGSPLAGASITTTPGGLSATSNASGAYSLSGVPVGIYQVSASRAGYATETKAGVEVRADEITTVDFTLFPGPPAGSLSGTVRDTSDRPLSGADVATTVGGYGTSTDAAGSYLLSGIAPGTYTVEASKAGYTPQSQSGVPVTAGGTTTLHFRLAPVVAPPPKVTNPNFEDDGGFFFVARAWTKFGGSKWEAVWDKDRVFTQGLSDISSTGVGVYQTIDVTPDATYRVTVYTKVTAPGYEGAVGVDPSGGTSAASATYGGASGASSWTAVTVSFKAKESKATIFLRGTRTTSLIGWVQFDAVTIEPTSGAAGTPATAVAARRTFTAPLAAESSPLAWSSKAFEEFVYQSGYGQIPRNWSAWFQNTNPATPGSREWNIVPGESGWAQSPPSAA